MLGILGGTGLLGVPRVLEVPKERGARGTEDAELAQCDGGPRGTGDGEGIGNAVGVRTPEVLNAVGTEACQAHQQPCPVAHRACRCPSQWCCVNTCLGAQTASGWWAPRPCTGSASAPPASTWHRPPCSSTCAPALTAVLSSTTGTGMGGRAGLGWRGMGLQTYRVAGGPVTLMLTAPQVLAPEAAGAGGALGRQLLHP